MFLFFVLQFQTQSQMIKIRSISNLRVNPTPDVGLTANSWLAYYLVVIPTHPLPPLGPRSRGPRRRRVPDRPGDWPASGSFASAVMPSMEPVVGPEKAGPGAASPEPGTMTAGRLPAPVGPGRPTRRRVGSRAAARCSSHDSAREPGDHAEPQLLKSRRGGRLVAPRCGRRSSDSVPVPGDPIIPPARAAVQVGASD
jgi:hypothetical protein